MPRWKANIMINTFALINFAAITGKLKEWVMINHDCTIDAKRFKSKINDCIMSAEPCSSLLTLAATNS